MEGTIASQQMDELVDQICDLIEEHDRDMQNWTRETRASYQDEVLRRVRNELDAREA